MHKPSFKKLTLITFVLFAMVSNLQASGDTLPSWNDGANKSAIINFVKAVTNKKSADFVPVPERIATFDNDGTLWSEQPLYFQGFFALSQISRMAKDHPEWKDTEQFKSALAGDMKGLMAGGEAGLMQLLVTAHSGMTADEFALSVSEWAAGAKNPMTGMLYTQMVFQPMLELMNYLRANHFKVFIVYRPPHRCGARVRLRS